MKLTERLSFRREFITTPLIFLVFLAFFSKVNYDFQSFIPSLVQGINSLTARLSVLLLTTLNINAAVENSYVLLPMHSQIEIIYECTGIYILLLFVSFILSYPTTLSKKLTGIFFGVPLLYSFNIFRIAVLGILEIFSPAFFDFFHLYLWEATFIAFVLLVAYCWIIWIAETGHTISGRQLRFIKPIIQFAIFSILFFILIRLLLNPYSLLQQRLLKAILASDLFTLKKTIEISAGKGILWLQEQNGASQPIYLTHLTFNLVPFLALTMLLRLSPFSKIIGMLAGALLILMSQTFWLTVIALRVITPTPGILTLFNLYQMFNLALPILLWVPLLYLSRKTLRREEHREPPRAVFLPAQGEPLSYPRLSSTICYLLLGVVTPVVLLFSVFQLRLGYFVALIIWFLGAILILPEPPFILQMKNRKRSIFISLLLFWQVPFTAATLTYLPPHQRVGLIHPSGKFTLLGEGIHFRLPLKKKRSSLNSLPDLSPFLFLPTVSMGER